MSETSNPALEKVAEVLADGLPVDWDALRTDAPAMTEQIERLRTVAEVAAAYRELRESTDPTPED